MRQIVAGNAILLSSALFQTCQSHKGQICSDPLFHRIAPRFLKVQSTALIASLVLLVIRRSWPKSLSSSKYWIDYMPNGMPIRCGCRAFQSS